MVEQEFSGKMCVVAGTGRGIGGYMICRSKSEHHCSALAQDMRNQGYSAEHMVVDVSCPDLVSDVCKTTLQKHSGVDILVNNAGITRDNLMLTRFIATEILIRTSVITRYGFV
jgi:3-oxoacyl-[acyl-carrier protein] reductase